MMEEKNRAVRAKVTFQIQLRTICVMWTLIPNLSTTLLDIYMLNTTQFLHRELMKLRIWS